MTTVSLDRLTAYAARGAAPPMRECLAALAAGRLWDVVTGNAGYDCIAVSDDAEDVIHETAALVDFIDPVGLGWSSSAITALHGTLYDGAVSVRAVPRTAAGRVRVTLVLPVCDGAGPVPWLTTPEGYQHDYETIHSDLARVLCGLCARTISCVADDSGERWVYEVAL
jgi:hypothetical protein